MDPIRIIRPANIPDSDSGDVLFIPFEGFNPRVINGVGQADWVLASDLPPFRERGGILEFLANEKSLTGRIIQYQEYPTWEVMITPQLARYVEICRQENRIR